MAYYLGVDGGGTKTDFVLAKENGEVLGRYVSGGSNPNDIGIDGTYELLAEGVRKLCAQTGVDEREVYLYVGGSGCGVGTIASELTERMKTQVKACAFSSDLPNVAEVGLRGRDGVAVIAGTGSVFALRREGALTVVGGNGYLFEEYGSGFAFARAGFIAAFAQLDGLGKPTKLTEKLERATGGLKKNLNELYRGGKRYIASFAPLVFEAAAEGDEIALKIVEDNASYLSSTLNTLSEAFLGEVEVALAGGTFKNAYFLGLVQKGLRGNIRARRVTQAPVVGATALAVRLAGRDPSEGLIAAVEKSMETIKIYYREDEN